MARDQTDGLTGGVPSDLLDALADPERARRRLPALLTLLDADDVERRLTGSWAVCLVVERHPDVLPYVVRRLADRLGDDGPIEAAHALDYLAARRPRDVDEVVAVLDEEREVRTRERLFWTGAGFAHSADLVPSAGDGSVGRTRASGGKNASDLRRVQVEEPSGDGAAGTDAGDASGGESVESDPADASEDEGPVTETTARADPSRARLSKAADRLAAVAAESRFEDLEVLSDGRRGRYGETYRAVATDGDEERPVAPTVYRMPADDRAAFARDLRDALADWAAVSDHEGIRTVLDWGTRPRPWAALEYASVPLADRDDLDPEAALRHARQLATAVAEAHQRGVVHGALDPRTVVYRDTALTAPAAQRPLVSAVGIGPLFARAFADGPTPDPRYAAPEWVDDRFGGVNHATDVYALGALIYRLCTGEHPEPRHADGLHEGPATGDLPAATAVDPSLPAELDAVVAKAMAPRKLTRYETATQLARELRGIGDA